MLRVSVGEGRVRTIAHWLIFQPPQKSLRAHLKKFFFQISFKQTEFKLGGKKMSSGDG